MTDRPGPGASSHLAVLGAGPRALFALEALTARWDARPGPPVRAVTVTVVDPGEHPGTGAAYAPDQPDVLRLNVDVRLLDAPTTGAFPAFPAWAAQAEPALAEEPYPPRAAVGRYLAERWAAMERRLAVHAVVERVRAEAVGIDRGDGRRTRVRLVPAGGGVETVLGPVDEVLVVTGHARGHTGALAPTWRAGLPLRPAVLPAAVMLAPDAVPAGSRVALRGAALTFVDAALALTAGRGGRFVPSDGPTGLVHHRSADEPAVLFPVARSGLLLDAKPDPRRPLPDAVRAAAEAGRARLTAGTTGPAGPAAVHAEVVRTATAMLAAVRDLPAGAADVRRAVELTLATGVDPDLAAGPGRAEGMLRRSVAVADGTRAPGPAWALGRAWALLLPAVMGVLRGHDGPPEEFARYREDARVLERLAFGPPLGSARRLLAMVDAGAVDLSWLEAGVRLDGDGVHGLPPGTAPPDVVVDAVLAPPGAVDITDPLLCSVLAEGGVHVRPGRRGVVTAPDGTATDALGRPVEGLAVIGRAAEDHVIGHDTLNRHLHHEIDRWADRLAPRLGGDR